MRAFVLLLSALLASLPCAGSLPALCGDHHTSVSSCCQPQTHACKASSPASYCCPSETSTAPLPAAQVTMPAPLPAPELALMALPGPHFTPQLRVLHPASPPAPYRPALYLLHRSYRI